MADVAISLYQKREAIAGGFKVTNSITAATDVNDELFLYKRVDGSGPVGSGGKDVYQHVATVLDIQTYPKFTDAVSTDLFYRHAQAILEFNTLAAADGHADLVKVRMSELQAAFDAAADGFEDGPTDYVYESADAEVKITVAETLAQPDDNTYRVTEVIGGVPPPTGIVRDLFLFEPKGGTATPNDGVDVYTRVVTPYDIATYPNVVGWTSEAYYRHHTVINDDVLMANAVTFATATKAALEALAQTYDTYVDDFVGEETTTYP